MNKKFRNGVIVGILLVNGIRILADALEPQLDALASKFNTGRKMLIATIASAKAGLIVANCKTGCRINDEDESVEACFLHEHEIAALSRTSLENWPEHISDPTSKL